MVALPTPTHVPEHLIRPYGVVMGATTNENPFKSIIPRLQLEPEIFYALHAYPGELPSWIFRKARDLIAIYQDNKHFTTNGASPFAQVIGDNWLLVPSDIDPPMHEKYRAMLNPLFTQRKIQAMDDRVRQLAREHIENFRHAGRCEFMSEFAFRFPIAVFAELMGLPSERIDEFLEWEMMLLHAPSVEVMRQGVLSVKAYLMSVI
jgi:cytochrome P450